MDRSVWIIIGIVISLVTILIFSVMLQGQGSGLESFISTEIGGSIV